MNDKINGIIKSFFDNIYQLDPNKLLSSLKSKFFKLWLYL
jgi:hypothetical protein